MISKLTAIIMAIVSFISSFGSFLTPKNDTLYDVSYGQEVRQVMDISFPGEYSKSRGVLLFIHGGGWISGDKSKFTPKVMPLSDKLGCIVVCMNYRYISASVHCDDLLDDIDSALSKVKSMALLRGIKTTKVMLAGYSAGAHLSMLYAYSRKNTAPIKPGAVASYSGPTDLSSERFIEQNTLSGPDYMRGLVSMLCGQTVTATNFQSKKSLILKYSPINYVSSACVPTIIFQGKNDGIVKVEDTRVFVNTLKSKGVTYKYYELPKSAHSLKEDPELFKQGQKTFVSYVNKYIK